MHKFTSQVGEEENKFHITIPASCIITPHKQESVTVKTYHLLSMLNEQVHKVSEGIKRKTNMIFMSLVMYLALRTQNL